MLFICYNYIYWDSYDINRQQGTESRNILFAGLDQPIKSCEKMFLIKIVLNDVKGQRTNIRTVYKIKLNQRTETRKQNSQSLLLPSHKEAKNILKKYR